MIFQSGNVHESASLFNLKEKEELIRKTVGFAPTTEVVHYTTLTNRPLRICWIGVKQFKYIYHQPQPQKRT